MRRWLWVLALLAPVLPAQEKVDLSAIHRIRTEAFEGSKVMDHMFYLTDVHGPRLTGAPGFQAAGDWAVGRLKEWGLDSAVQEKWGPFGRGWSSTRVSVHLLEPQYGPLIAVPLSWSPGTGGPIQGEPMLAVLPAGPQRQGGAAAGPRPESPDGPGGGPGAAGAADAELNRFIERYKGKLKGKILMISQPRPLEPQTTAASQRFNETTLAAQALAPPPGRAAARRPFDDQATRRRNNKRNQFLRDEGVLGVVQMPFRGDGGTIFAGSFGSRHPDDPPSPPAIALASEHYNRIARLLEKKVPVRLEIDVQAKFHDQSLDSFNVVGEIPGGDKKDEVVMLGAHLDSYSAGTGATDNAAGSAVVMEAMRVLKTLNLKMDRTVRLALWSGEEQGLLGSRAYVKQHFGDRETMALKPEHAKLAGYFNIDNGTGKIRGVYLQNNDMMRPIFEAWFAPFQDLGVSTITIRTTGGTDHLSFDAVGLPGFQFIQDAVEYESRTHHSNMDVYDRIQASDLMQASAVLASMVYHAATRPEMLPRKPLPKPQPRRPEERKPATTGS